LKYEAESTINRSIIKSKDEDNRIFIKLSNREYSYHLSKNKISDYVECSDGDKFTVQMFNNVPHGKIIIICKDTTQNLYYIYGKKTNKESFELYEKEEKLIISILLSFIPDILVNLIIEYLSGYISI
jgi:hypothetical protein